MNLLKILFIIKGLQNKMHLLYYTRMGSSLETENSLKKKELERRLAGVDTANALMDIFGLKLSKESKKKVKAWKKALKNL